MTNINSVVLVGNLTRDCGSNERDFSYISSTGTAVANVSIAVNRSRKQGEEWVDEVSYFEVRIFGKTAENLKPYLLKGQKIVVSGYLKQERWQDKQTQQNMSKVVVVAESIELGGKKDGNSEPAHRSYQQSGKPRFEPAPQNQPTFNEGVADGSDDGDFPEDIPF